MEKIAIITSGYLPIPSVRGGGVEVLVDNLVLQNEIDQKVKLCIFSCYNHDAKQISSKYINSEFNYVKTNSIIQSLDKFVYFIASKILKMNKPYSYRYIFQRLRYIKKVSNLLSENDYDKVIIENNAVLLSVLKKKRNYKKYKDKYYLHLHNEILNDFNNYSILKNAKKILCVSNYLSETTAKKFNQISEKKFDVVLNGVDLNRFRIINSNEKIKSIKQRFNIKDEDFVFLYTGRITKEKGVLELLNAFVRIDNPNAKLVIVGSSFFGTAVKSTFEKEVEQIVSQMEEKVIFTGFIPNDQLYEIYNIADVSVLPSIWGEPAGLTMVESICSGTPVITTNSGGIPEYIDKKCAVILENDNQLIDNLIGTMENFFTDKEFFNEMKRNAIKERNKYGIQTYYANFIRAIND